MVHQVERGETLYSIAWRYDLDVRKLARINGIKAPFVISQGRCCRWIPVLSGHSHWGIG